MRDFRFRVWDAALEEMFYSNNCFMIFDDGKLIERDGRTSDIFQDNDIVMQYIGIEDTEGKPIYEGDIVKYGYIESIEDEHHIGEVKYLNEEADYPAFDVEPRPHPGFDCNIISYFLNDGFIKVIGNKFEDPKLRRSI